MSVVWWSLGREGMVRSAFIGTRCVKLELRLLYRSWSLRGGYIETAAYDSEIRSNWSAAWRGYDKFRWQDNRSNKSLPFLRPLRLLLSRSMNGNMYEILLFISHHLAKSAVGLHISQVAAAAAPLVSSVITFTAKLVIRTVVVQWLIVNPLLYCPVPNTWNS